MSDDTRCTLTDAGAEVVRLRAEVERLRERVDLRTAQRNTAERKHAACVEIVGEYQDDLRLAREAESEATELYHAARAEVERLREERDERVPLASYENVCVERNCAGAEVERLRLAMVRAKEALREGFNVDAFARLAEALAEDTGRTGGES